MDLIFDLGPEIISSKNMFCRRAGVFMHLTDIEYAIDPLNILRFRFIVEEAAQPPQRRRPRNALGGQFSERDMLATSSALDLMLIQRVKLAVR